jgi:lysine-specific demethylase/histidyl-hydroxylase NO66
MVGANAYLTPKGASQGFAPHYDDIEAFCLQLEGRKRWKVYAPTKEERLPRVSSADFSEESMRDLEPVLDVVMEPGDFLYMPRGWIHHGITLPPSQGNEHSLHLTMSSMQHWAWVDFMQVLIPEALEAAASSETSVSLRTGLPRNFLDYMGAMHDQRDDALPEQLRAGPKAKKETPIISDENEQKEQGENDDESPEEEEKRRRIIRLQEKFRNDAKKKIMRVAKEVRTTGAG